MYTLEGFHDSDQYFKGKLLVRLSNEYEYWNYSIAARSVNGQILEFGVCGGSSINYIADRVQGSKVYGFDSFKGLPERWYNMGIGTFKLELAELDSLPQNVRSNVELVTGLFEDTLPSFVKEHPEPISLLHVDCDLYSSAATVFRVLGPQIIPGTIIMFDEYIDYPGWQEHEYKAFQEFISVAGRTYEYLSFNPNNPPYPGRASVRMKS
jgi:hypothetical protein